MIRNYNHLLLRAGLGAMLGLAGLGAALTDPPLASASTGARVNEACVALPAPALHELEALETSIQVLVTGGEQS